MNRRAAIRKLGIAGAGVFLRRLAGQVEGEPDFVIRSDVRLVLLDVSVKDHEGKLVAGLSSDSFTVLENGIAQRITVFANDDLPVTVGILVDESRSMGPKRTEVVFAAEDFIGSSNPLDEVFVLNFNDSVTRGLPGDVLFSSDVEQLRAALDRGVARGMTALNDAVLDGLEQLQQGKRDKKSLIVISDGGDNGSRRTRGEMFDRLERSIATVYTVGLSGPDNPDQDPGVLKRLAKISGGEAYFPASLAGLPAVCQEIAADIRTRYTVGFAPKSINGFGSLRKIQVNVTAPGRGKLTARTRTSYRYEDSANRG
jgi:Ca-activated chloride channel family protein